MGSFLLLSCIASGEQEWQKDGERHETRKKRKSRKITVRLLLVYAVQFQRVFQRRTFSVRAYSG